MDWEQWSKTLNMHNEQGKGEPSSPGTTGSIQLEDKQTHQTVLSSVHKENQEPKMTASSRNIQDIGDDEIVMAADKPNKAPDVRPRSKINATSLKKKIASCSSLSWTDANDDWSDYIQPTHRDTGKYMLELMDKDCLLKAQLPMKFTPSKEIIMQVGPSCTAEVLRAIEERYRNQKGFVIATTNWLSLVTHSPPEGISRPAYHSLDFMIVTDHEGEAQVELVTLASPQLASALKDDKVWADTVVVGRIAKQQILKQLPCQETTIDGNGVGFAFSCRALIGDRCVEEYKAREHRSNRCKLDDIQTSLARQMLSHETYMRTLSGQNICLTPQQLSIGIEAQVPWFSLIFGPPGCGKSVLGQYIYRQLERENPNTTKYASTNPAFEVKIRHEGIKRTTTIKKTTQFDELVSELAQDRCVIIDDVQNLECSDAWWKKFFKFISSKSMKLILLMDNKIQNFKSHSSVETLLEKYCKKNGITLHRPSALSVVHRNSQKIVAYMANSTEQNLSSNQPLTCSSPDVGDKIETLTIQGLWDTTSNNQLVQFLKKLTDQNKVMSIERGYYEASQIAVLIDSNKPQKDIAAMTSILEGARFAVHSASVHPRTGIVIDTVDAMCGLDSEVVVYIASPERQKKSLFGKDKTRSMKDKRYRAFIASRALFRLIYVVGEMNVGVAQTLKYDLDR